MMKQSVHIVVAAMMALLLTGCPSLWGSKVSDKPPGPEEMYKDAEARFKDKDYTAAAELYERLKTAHPDFEKIPEVYVKIADAYYESGDYEKATSRYHNYIELHPGHEEVPRAKYQVAMCYFQQMQAKDLDSRATAAAAERFKALRDDPDAGKWAKEASKKYDECRKKLAEKELDKANTYVSMGNYRSARLAAKRVLEEYGKLGLDKEAEDFLKSIKGK